MTRNATLAAHRCRFGIFLVVALGVCLAPRCSMASLRVSILPVNTTAMAGSTGDAFDVTLTNTGPSAVSVGAFAFELSVSSSYISLTQATTASSTPYIFAGSSALGPTISVSPPALPGQVLMASDLTLLPFITVASGSTVGLGHVLFDVSPFASTSAVPVVFTVPNTNLSDSSGDSIPIDAFSPGTIDIQAMVPEPSMFVIFVVGIGLVGVVKISRELRRRV